MGQKAHICYSDLYMIKWIQEKYIILNLGFGLKYVLALWHMDRFRHYNLSSQKRSKQSFDLEAMHFPNDQLKFSA